MQRKTLFPKKRNVLFSRYILFPGLPFPAARQLSSLIAVFLALLASSCQKSDLVKDEASPQKVTPANEQAMGIMSTCCKTWLETTASDGHLTLRDDATGNSLEVPDNLFDLSNTPSENGSFCLLKCTEEPAPSPEKEFRIKLRDNLMQAWYDTENLPPLPPSYPSKYYYSIQHIYSSYMSASTMSNKTAAACLAFKFITSGTDAPTFNYTDPAGLAVYLSKNQRFTKVSPATAFSYAQQGMVVFMLYVNLDPNGFSYYTSKVGILDGEYNNRTAITWYDGSTLYAYPVLGVGSVADSYPSAIQSKIVFFIFGA